MHNYTINTSNSNAVSESIPLPPGVITISDDGTLHLHDGSTPGGQQIGGGGAAYSNANVAGYLTNYNSTINFVSGAANITGVTNIIGNNSDANVYIQTVSGGQQSTWTFGIDGQMTLPSNNPTISGSGSGSNVIINSSNSTVTSNWVFDISAVVSLPDYGSVPTTSPPNGPSFAQHTGTLYWYNGTTWKTVTVS